MALKQSINGNILYAIAYERGLENAGFIYLHAKDIGDAVKQIVMSKGFLPVNVRVVSIAPAVGLPKTQKEKPIRIFT